MKKNDLILIAVILIIALICSICYQLFYKKDGSMVTVSVDNKTLYSLPLNQNTSIIIPSENNQSNLLIIQDGYAYISEASCPDKLCVHQKKIRYSGESIICLPNKVVVTISGEEITHIDAISN